MPLYGYAMLPVRLLGFWSTMAGIMLKEGGGDTGNPRTGSGALTQVGKKGCGGGVQAPSERNVTAVCTSVTMTHRGR